MPSPELSNKSLSNRLRDLIKIIFIGNQNVFKIFNKLFTQFSKDDPAAAHEKMVNEFNDAVAQIALKIEPLGLDAIKLVPIWTEHKPISTDLDPESERFLLKWLTVLLGGIFVVLLVEFNSPTEQFASEFLKGMLGLYLLSILVAVIKDHLTTQAKVERNLATIAHLAKIDPNLPLYFHKKYGIRLYDRYTISYYLRTLELEKELGQLLETEEKTRPTVLVVGGLVDTNNGFNWHTNVLPIQKEAAIQNDLWSHGYNYVNLEIESLEELLKLIQRLDKKLLDSVKYFVVKAHGKPDHITLSRSTNIDDHQTRKVNLGDEKTAELLRQIFSYLPADAEILLGSCYSATNNQSGLNIAEWLAKVTSCKTTGVTGKGTPRIVIRKNPNGSHRVTIRAYRSRTKTCKPK